MRQLSKPLVQRKLSSADPLNKPVVFTQPHHERGDEVVACALGAGDEDELPLAIAERLAVVGGLLGLHVRPPEGCVERRLDGRAPLHDLEEGLLLRLGRKPLRRRRRRRAAEIGRRWKPGVREGGGKGRW